MPSLWVRAVRVFMALMFLNYGVAKLADIQFNPAYYRSAFENVSSDDLNGFQLTWRFFNHSRSYQCLIGLAEVVPAVLLLRSRTALLGALAYFPVITNVVLVDLCFGIAAGPTLVAITLLGCDVLLLAADRDRIGRALVAMTQAAGHLTAPAREWRTTLLGWGCGLGLAAGVTVVAILLDRSVKGW